MKHFVFLQGMPSPFFSRIARQLKQRGARVSGINFCVGDWLFWRGGEATHYRGSLAQWSDFFHRYCQSKTVTDLVLLGEQRRYHKEAVAVAKTLGVRVTVTDFGYLRPDWITLEQDGMGGNSRFPVSGKPAALYSGRIDPGILRSSRIDDREGVTNGCAG
ncbi:capsular polysaccharide export protein, LipB/KpsS family [Ferrovum myxofaciens]|uniref:capsular polysaccharide export protein, LipB/KpsS family n=1 Tax=Ferrovum myxofaciens TaxID=416213 RepID=UPI003EB76BB9